MAAQQNIINDLATATKVPVKAIDALISRLSLCIGSAVHDAVKAEEAAIVLNIGLGTLSVNLVDMQCKFIPGKDLKAAIKKSVVDKADPLELKLEDELINKLLAICEEEL